MLLLLLSFYVYYDLLNCEEIVTAKFSESPQVDHQRQNLLQVNALLQDLEQKTRKLSVLLSDDYPYITRREETYFLRSKILAKDQNTPNPKDSIKPAEFLPSPRYDPFADFQVPPSVISPGPIGLVALKNTDVKPGHRLPYQFLKPVSSTFPKLNITTSLLKRKGPVLFTSNFLHPLSTTTPRPSIQQVTSTPLSSTPSPVSYPTPYYKLQSFNASSLSSIIKTITLSKIAKNWFQEIAPYTPEVNKLRKTSIDQPRLYKEEITVLILPRMTVPTGYRSSTGAGITTQQFREDKHGYPNMTLAKNVGRPETPEDPLINWTTPAGDVLHGKITVKKPSTLPPHQRYQDLMDQLKEGYLVVFGIEMFRLIAVKDKREVQEVLAPVENIYNTTLKSGRLIKVDNPFLTIFGKLAKMTSGDDIDALRTYSSVMFHVLLKRKEVLSPEVNSIIDQAGLFYSVEEGNRLLSSLSQFEDYPNTTKSSHSICENLVESLLQPFQRSTYSKTQQGLLSSINKDLRQNFPLLLREGSVGTLVGIERLLPRIWSQPRKRKKHHHKKKRKRKTHLEYSTTYNSQDLDSKDSWFRPITTKKYRTMDRRPTPAFIPLDQLDAHATNVLQRLRSKQMKKLLRET